MHEYAFIPFLKKYEKVRKPREVGKTAGLLRI
jgi:hypothetical protein